MRRHFIVTTSIITDSEGLVETKIIHTKELTIDPDPKDDLKEVDEHGESTDDPNQD